MPSCAFAPIGKAPGRVDQAHLRSNMKRILVVYKKDAYRQHLQEQPDAHLVKLLRRGQPDALELQRAHTIHEEALEAVVHALRQLPVEFELAYRADVTVTKRYDLVVS